MKTIIHKFWTEPAYCVAAIATVGVTVLQLVTLPDAIEIPLSALCVLLGGHVTRSLVRPVRS